MHLLRTQSADMAGRGGAAGPCWGSMQAAFIWARERCKRYIPLLARLHHQLPTRRGAGEPQTRSHLRGRAWTALRLHRGLQGLQHRQVSAWNPRGGRTQRLGARALPPPAAAPAAILGRSCSRLPAAPAGATISVGMAFVATAALLHSYHRCAQRLRVAKKRGLWLDAPGGPTLALAPEAGLELQGAPLLNLDDLDRRNPQRFYLPEASFEQLADWWVGMDRHGGRGRCVQGHAASLHGHAMPCRPCGRRAELQHGRVFMSLHSLPACTASISIAIALPPRLLQLCACGRRAPAAACPGAGG